MIAFRNIRHIWKKVIAVGLVCLFLVNATFQGTSYAYTPSKGLYQNLAPDGILPDEIGGANQAAEALKEAAEEILAKTEACSYEEIAVVHLAFTEDLILPDRYIGFLTRQGTQFNNQRAQRLAREFHDRHRGDVMMANGPGAESEELGGETAGGSESGADYAPGAGEEYASASAMIERLDAATHVVELANGKKLLIHKNIFGWLNKITRDTFVTCTRDIKFYTRCTRQPDGYIRVSYKFYIRPGLTVKIEVTLDPEREEVTNAVILYGEEEEEIPREELELTRTKEGFLRLQITSGKFGDAPPRIFIETRVNPEQVDEEGGVEVVSAAQTLNIQYEDEVEGTARAVLSEEDVYILDSAEAQISKNPLVFRTQTASRENVLGTFNYEEAIDFLLHLNGYFSQGGDKGFDFYLEMGKEGFPVCHFESHALKGFFPATSLVAPLGQIISDEAIADHFGDMSRDEISDSMVIEKLREGKHIDLVRKGHWDSVKASHMGLLQGTGYMDFDLAENLLYFHFHVHPFLGMGEMKEELSKLCQWATPDKCKEFEIDPADVNLLQGLSDASTVCLPSLPDAQHYLDIANRIGDVFVIPVIGTQRIAGEQAEREEPQIAFFSLRSFRDLAPLLTKIQKSGDFVFHPTDDDELNAAKLSVVITFMKNSRQAGPFSDSERLELAKKIRAEQPEGPAEQLEGPGAPAGTSWTGHDQLLLEANTIKFRKEHAARVRTIVTLLANRWNELQPHTQLTEADIRDLQIAALTHDLGYNYTPSVKVMREMSDINRRHNIQIRGSTFEDVLAQWKENPKIIAQEEVTPETESQADISVYTPDHINGLRVFFDHPQLSCDFLQENAEVLGMELDEGGQLNLELVALILHHVDSRKDSFPPHTSQKLILKSQLLHLADTLEASNNRKGGFLKRVLSLEKTVGDVRAKCTQRQVSPQLRDMAVDMLLRPQDYPKLRKVILRARAEAGRPSAGDYPDADKNFIGKELERQGLISSLGEVGKSKNPRQAYIERREELMAQACDILNIGGPEEFVPVRPVRCVILAAGEGRRLKEGTDYKGPKALYPIEDKPMIMYVLDNVRRYDPRPIVVVSENDREQIETVLTEAGYDVEYVAQDTSAKAIRGTGAGVLRAEEALKNFDGDLIISWVDNIVKSEETVRDSLLFQQATDAYLTVPTAFLEEPQTNIIQRDSATGHPIGTVQRLDVERLPPGEADIGLFVGRAQRLFEALKKMKDTGQGLTTVAAGEQGLGFPFVMQQLAGTGETCAIPLAEPTEASSINTVEQAALVSQTLAKLAKGRGPTGTFRIAKGKGKPTALRQDEGPQGYKEHDIVASIIRELIQNGYAAATNGQDIGKVETEASAIEAYNSVSREVKSKLAEVRRNPANAYPSDDPNSDLNEPDVNIIIISGLEAACEKAGVSGVVSHEGHGLVPEGRSIYIDERMFKLLMRFGSMQERIDFFVHLITHLDNPIGPGESPQGYEDRIEELASTKRPREMFAHLDNLQDIEWNRRNIEDIHKKSLDIQKQAARATEDRPLIVAIPKDLMPIEQGAHLERFKNEVRRQMLSNANCHVVTKYTSEELRRMISKGVIKIQGAEFPIDNTTCLAYLDSEVARKDAAVLTQRARILPIIRAAPEQLVQLEGLANLGLGFLTVKSENDIAQIENVRELWNSMMAEDFNAEIMPLLGLMLRDPVKFVQRLLNIELIMLPDMQRFEIETLRELYDRAANYLAGQA